MPSRLYRRINFYQVLFEIVAVFCLVFLALMGVKNLSAFPSTVATAFGISALIGALQTVFHVGLGGYSYSWRFFSFQDGKAALLSIVSAVLFSCLAAYSTISITGWIIVLCAAIAGVIGPRLCVRISHSHNSPLWNVMAMRKESNHSNRSQKLLMLGFGDHVANFIRLQNRVGSDYEVIGIVHIEAECEATSLRGVPVIGSIDSLESIIRRFTSNGNRLDCLVLTRDEMSNRTVSEILSITDRFDIPISWLPRTDRIDSSSGLQLRPIKLDDLLPRPANIFDAQACCKLMSDAVVLVTGAGGSIGSELVRQIGTIKPKTVILTDASEHALYMIDQEIGRVFPSLKIVAMLLDVRDRDAVFRVVEKCHPDYIFHAAALKHVPIVEAQACEGVLTNVVGSRNVADAAAAVGVTAMVMVSTDKAVNPANVMGATKRLAEAYCQAMNAMKDGAKSGTRYITVRFGNVLGSSGSVVPLFQKQLGLGGPLTVTHPDVERFFMTIPEASRLILQALLLGIDEDSDDQGIFVLNMGEPVRIADLARQMIRLSGLTPERDMKILYTGLRPGEKLYEELMHETENTVPTEHPNLVVARPRFVQIKTVRSQIDVIQDAAVTGNSDEVMRLLKFYIPEFEATARVAQLASGRGVQASSRPEAI